MLLVNNPQVLREIESGKIPVRNSQFQLKKKQKM
jgi:hypothetical protein